MRRSLTASFFFYLSFCRAQKRAEDNSVKPTGRTHPVFEKGRYVLNITNPQDLEFQTWRAAQLFLKTKSLPGHQDAL
jgi:hypothetical protein